MGRPPVAPSPSWHADAPHRGFTVVELIVCLGVISILCGILLPSLRATREQANRLECSSNMHQIGVAIGAWGLTHDQEVPRSRNADPATLWPQELMAARLVGSAEDAVKGWDGLGLLARDGYLGPAQCKCLHCGSHRGEHSYERYAQAYANETRAQIYTNYHYSGHVTYQYDPDDPRYRKVTLTAGSDIVILTDGLRSRADFNHGSGLNRMFADLSVEWWADDRNLLLNDLPESPSTEPPSSAATFKHIWDQVSASSKN